MIQAQFDAVSSSTDVKPFGALPDSSEDDVPERPTKRRRTSIYNDRIFPNLGSRGSTGKVAEMECIVVHSETQGSIAVEGSAEKPPNFIEDVKGTAQATVKTADSIMVGQDDSVMSTAQTIICAPSYSPRASPRQPQAHDLNNEAPSDFPVEKPFTSTSTSISMKRTPIPSRLRQNQFLLSSSPLSSPPPVLFDPYDDSSIVVSSSPTSRESSSSRETEDTPPSSQSIFGSQLSNSSRSTLPNLKGRDLFDVSIWSDPLKTSVFYAFTTTLRQKARASTPTGCHYFISHLRDTGKLVRCYTQNIDQMEEKVGLTTGLSLGPGSRGRFSTRSARASGVTPSSDLPSILDSSDVHDGNRRGSTPSNRGVECVFLHGSLHALRCFQCGQITNWDDDGREHETLSGRQPTCPHCEGATAARQERGKRALGIGKLRPDIVLYGEEHPSADLISPIVQHDLSLAPDMLLILGTSLKVHGLKVMVREFAKAVHNKGGKVVFVNYTKPAESTWSDIIDYWVQWDCDAWVDDLKERKPILWLPPGTSLKVEGKSAAKKKQEATVAEPKPKLEKLEKSMKPVKQSKPEIPENTEKPEKSEKPEKPEPKRPMAIRDDKVNGAYLVCKILRNLERISGRASISQADLRPVTVAPLTKPKRARARKSAPAALENKPPAEVLPITILETQQTTVKETVAALNSSPLPIAAVAAAVKSNPRTRKRKTMFGEDPTLEPLQKKPAMEGQAKTTRKQVTRPAVLPEDKENVASQPVKSHLHAPRASLPSSKALAGLALPPLRNIDRYHSSPSRAVSSPFPRPTPLEPLPLTSGPLSTISPNIIGRWTMGPSPKTPCRPPGITAAALQRWKDNPFFYQDALASYLRQPPTFPGGEKGSLSPTEQLLKEEEAAITLSVLRDGTVTK